ncbi:MAG: flagellar hook-basal body complex protein FliE [Candidatus Solibacter usitatus]|nr:flagellar hook-basal body complex protein FliE [Candidatus Solibacter usitatus]
MLNPIIAIRPPDLIAPVQSAAQAHPGAFQSVFGEALKTVDSLHAQSSGSIERFLSGEGEDLHRVALEQQRAAVAFDLFLQVRNKMVQAYQELMRMQV